MQFSLFGAEALDPALADVEGLLIAGGHLVRAPVDGAGPAEVTDSSAPEVRLSIVVDSLGRADAIVAALTERGLRAERAPIGERFVARSDFSDRLAPVAREWAHGANEEPPDGFVLTPGGLRLWAICAGRADGVGYLLGTDDLDSPRHRAGGAQLARLGLAAVAIGRGGPGWRIISSRRLRRLAELIGPAPAGADWPE